jgi:hypothetical protein
MWRLRMGVVSAVLSLVGALSVLPVQTADAQPASPVIVLPSDNATLSGTEYFDATAAAGVTQVQYELTGGSLSDQVIATATPTIFGWAAAWDTTTVANGTYTLESVATYAGGVTPASTPVTITVDNGSPSTTVVYPAGGATLDQTQTQYFDAVASPGVTHVTIDLTLPGGSLLVAISTTPTIVGWVGVVQGTPTQPSCIPVPIPVALQSVATYAGGVSGTSAPVPETLDVYVSGPPPAPSC